ncbi:hypothetical protein GCM10011506_29980 [Marivirga lumbricoides]|uniref:YCII-related domain-containing protein n=1 Tax=Marivirga lumbricoides TaxID=1046115 RepID=A0ABQ1MKS5_9BACT|nr:hypothetical protein GCM10011506_29980 [Marivirga lumbricoides]
MKLDLNKLYIVYIPTKNAEKEDVFDGHPDTLEGLFNQVRGGLKIENIHAIYSTSAEAEKESAKLLIKRMNKVRQTSSVKKGSGFAIFGAEVKASDKYKVQSKPKVYITKKAAMIALDKMLKKGWKRSELKILRY